MEALIPNQLGVLHPIFRIVMAGRNVTADLSPYLLSVSYTDFVEGEADTLDIRMEDAEGKFRGSWYPDKGDVVHFHFGYAGDDLQYAGAFEIDEIEGEGPPDVVVIRAIAAGKVAAANIDEYLGFHHEIDPGVEIPTARLNNKPPHGRINTTEREADERKRDFKCIECGLTDEEAYAEASRCLRCDHFGYGIFRGGRKSTW